MLRNTIEVEMLRIQDPSTEEFSLHNAVYNEARTRRDWVWEYATHLPSLSVFTVAKHRNRIVGTQGMLPIYLNIRGQRHLTGKSESSLMERDYRGGTIFRDLYAYAMAICEAQGMCCVWGFTSAVSVWRDKLGFSVYEGVMQTYALALTRGPIPETKGRKRGALSRSALSTASTLFYLYCLIRRTFFKKIQNVDHENFVVEEKLRNISDLDRLYERLRVRNDEMIHIVLHPEYISWRITENPNVKYRTCFLYDGELLRAYTYLNIDKDNVVRLTDFTAEDEVSAVVLLDYLLTVLSMDKVRFLLFMGNIKNPLIREVLSVFKKAGFFRLGTFRMSFVLKNISCEESLNQVSNWYMNGLWTEGYQW